MSSHPIPSHPIPSHRATPCIAHCLPLTPLASFYSLDRQHFLHVAEHGRVGEGLSLILLVGECERWGGGGGVKRGREGCCVSECVYVHTRTFSKQKTHIPKTNRPSKAPKHARISQIHTHIPQTNRPSTKQQKGVKPPTQAGAEGEHLEAQDEVVPRRGQPVVIGDAEADEQALPVGGKDDL